MSLKTKLISLCSSIIILLIASSCIVQWFETNQLKKETNQVIRQLNSNSEESVKQSLMQLATDIQNHIVLLEEEVNKNMLNAAYTLQQMDSTQDLTTEDLSALARKSNMTDVLLTDDTGLITLATDPNSVGLNLISLDVTHNQILTKESEIVTKPLGLKASSGDVFKFVTIPRVNGGIVETALNASFFENSLMSFIESGKGIQGLYLMDPTNLVITEAIAEGTAPLWKKGEMITESNITNVFSTAEPVLSMEDNLATIYYPIKIEDKVRYVLNVQIETTTHFLNANLSASSLEEVQTSLVVNNVKIIIISSVLSILFILFLILVVRKSFKPLETLTKQSRQMAQGDLTNSKILVSSAKDEIGLLVKAFGLMATNLQEIILRVSKDTEQIAASAEELTASSEQLTATSEHITASIQEVSSGTETQVEESEKTKEALLAMMNHVQKIKENSSKVTESIHITTDKATEGNDIIHTVLNQMSTINNRVKETANLINHLGNEMMNIQSMSKVITNIAEQTNLLALNATIEAARAGEHGKGFAVVASEVKKLAEQSSDSAKQINEFISTIQVQTMGTVQSMVSTTTEVENGILLVDQTGQSFNEIKEAIVVVQNELTEVSISVNHLSTETEQISSLLNLVKNVAEDIEYRTKNVSSSTEEQLTATEEISASALHLAEMVEELHELLGKFKV